jgi:CBS domain-containing protein
MTAIELIAHDIPALKVEQTGKDAFHLLSDFHVKHLPVIEGQRLVGIISEEDIFNHKLYDTVREYDFSLHRPFSVRPEEHLFEIMRLMGENRLTILPVTDSEGTYLGMISQNTLLKAFSNLTAFSMQGGVIIMEMNQRDYALSTIARIVEEENAKVLAVFISSSPEAELLEVTLKINRPDVSRIVASLERHKFVVRQTLSTDAYYDTLKDRYDALMSYLKV